MLRSASSLLSALDESTKDTIKVMSKSKIVAVPKLEYLSFGT